MKYDLPYLRVPCQGLACRCPSLLASRPIGTYNEISLSLSQRIAVHDLMSLYMSRTRTYISRTLAQISSVMSKRLRRGVKCGESANELLIHIRPPAPCILPHGPAQCSSSIDFLSRDHLQDNVRSSRYQEKCCTSQSRTLLFPAFPHLDHENTATFPPVQDRCVSKTASAKEQPIIKSHRESLEQEMPYWVQRTKS